MTIQRWGLFLLAIPLLLVFGSPAQGQVALSHVTGVVADSQSLAIPGAQVTIRNVGTGIETSAESNESGYYTLVSLNPGDYELVVTSEGFRSYVQQGIRLETGLQVRIDVELELGVVTESVTVVSGAPAINLERGAIKGDVILYEELQDLPLLGRDFTELAYLIPGVVPRGRGAGSFASINGARGDQTNFYVDGVSNRNPVGGGAQVRPPLDAVEEFRVETSGFSAEYGGFSGGIVGITMRSGQNQFHGSVFEYKRNEFMDARRLFDQERLRLRRDQFGGTLSGPIVKNRSFFLFSYEGRYNSVQQTRYGRVPTAAQRRGDFSNSVDLWKPPIDGQLQPFYLNDPDRKGACNAKNQKGCFPNMMIPASLHDPAALHLINLYPVPAEVENRRSALNQRLNHHNVAQDDDDWHQMVVKFDQNFSPKDTFSASYQKRFNNNMAPFAGSPLAIWGNLARNRRSLLSVRHTHTFSPTLVLEFAGGYSQRDNFVTSIAADDDPATIGLPVPEDLPEHLVGLPRVNVNGHWPLGQGANTPNEQEIMDLQFTGRLSWIRQSHTIKMGFDFNRTLYDQPLWNNARGTFVFNRKFTKHSVGDLLLGRLTNSNRRVSTTENALRADGFGMFLNDDWKVNRNLTLNLGVRYEFDLPPYDVNDRLSTYRPDLNKVVLAGDKDLPNLAELLEAQGLTGRTALAKDVGMSRRLIDPDFNNISPRLGFAWRPFGDNKHVIRGGYGIFYQGYLLNPVRSQLAGGFPFTLNQAFNSANRPGIPLPTIQNPFPEGRAAIPGGQAGVNNVNAFDPDPPSAYLQSWNFTVERDVGGGQVVEIGYVGSKGTHLQRRYNLNLPIRDPALATIGANGNYIFPRPIEGFNNLNYNSFGANSTFHSMQASLRRRSRSGFFYRLNYTFGKSIDDASTHNDGRVGTGGALDNRNLKLDRGRSNFDQRHVVTIATRYPMPIGRGRHFLPNLRGPVQAIIGGWQLASTVRAYSGQPFSVLTSNVDLNAGESRRPNRIGHGYQDPSAADGRKGVDFPWYDITAFERVPCIGTENNNGIECVQSAHGFEPFNPGDSGRNILDMPGQFNMNLSLQKNFQFENRRRLQVRLDAFNALNAAQLGNLTAAAASFDGIQGGLIANSRPARIMQASLSYYF